MLKSLTSVWWSKPPCTRLQFEPLIGRRYFDWISEDKHIAGLSGFHFGTYGPTQLGLVSLPQTESCYMALSTQLIAFQYPKPTPGPHNLPGTKNPPSHSGRSSGGHHVPVAAIVAPILIVVAGGVVGGFFVWRRRRATAAMQTGIPFIRMD
mmetsp:Transcript_53277/g.115681  ORF Transcript_53277/g.115681 Transcript_53277/m.115681 type:complete len:151 (-) Transcript_53277:52-504(-)